MMNIDKSIKKIIGKPKMFGGKNDWDGDGVPNKKDCQPRNIMRQDKWKKVSKGHWEKGPFDMFILIYENASDVPPVIRGLYAVATKKRGDQNSVSEKVFKTSGEAVKYAEKVASGKQKIFNSPHLTEMNR